MQEELHTIFGGFLRPLCINDGMLNVFYKFDIRLCSKTMIIANTSGIFILLGGKGAEL